ncbi:hypothetical protein CAAN3_02S06194 [[Candida] anglica]
MSLGTRLASYYRHHVLVTVKLSPSPSSAAEVDHLYESFSRLGNLEYFKIPRNQTLNRFSPYLTMLFNPAKESIVSPFSLPPGFALDTPQFLDIQQSLLKQKLASILAIPRYSYIENDQEYHDGELQVPFKYHASKRALFFESKVHVTPSTINDPFCYIETKYKDLDISHFRKDIRHNFQIFHKLDSISLLDGVEGVNKLGGRLTSEPDYIQNVMDVSDSTIYQMKE